MNWLFETRSDIVIVGSNPENADYTNPRGHIYGDLWIVRASNDHGDTRELAVLTSGSGRICAVGGSDTKAAAEKLAERLNARMAAGKLPVGFSLWPAGRAVYGSDAWVEYGNDEEMALERREAEDEYWN